MDYKEHTKERFKEKFKHRHSEKFNELSDDDYYNIVNLCRNGPHLLIKNNKTNSGKCSKKVIIEYNHIPMWCVISKKKKIVITIYPIDKKDRREIENFKKMKKIKINEEFLGEYLNSNSPTGFEYELGGQKIWMEYISKFTDNVKLDAYGTAYAEMGNLESDFKVVIEAHADEISWFVNYIDKDGYIKVIKNGGSDTTIAPSMRVILWGDKGPINGVFGHPAIHIKDRKTEATLNSIFIDVGASSKDEVIKMGINIGTVITFKDGLMALGDDYYCGRALDNRIGGFMIAEVARRLKENDIQLPYKLYIANCVQEEVGSHGAKMIASKLKPNVAIITDVCHETSSPAYKASDGEAIAGRGGVITRAPAVHNKLRQLVIDTAENNKIDYQRSAKSSSTGTDTDSFAFSNDGIPSVLISLPLKYMHTTTETVHKKDIRCVINLIYETLLNIEENHNFNYNI